MEIVHALINLVWGIIKAITTNPFVLGLILLTLVAGAGIEPASPSAEPGVLPLHQPAIFVTQTRPAAS